MTDQNYFLKQDYVSNDVSYTFDTDDRAYWTDERIQLSQKYQFYVYDFARQLMLENGYKSVLDVGSGPPLKVKILLAPICKDILLLDQPSSKSLAARILPDAKFIAANFEEPIPDLGRQFDIVICSDVIEHLVKPNHCADFVAKHVSASGRALISTPERDFLRGPNATRSPKAEHIREWNGKEFRRYIESRGLDVLDQHYYPQMRISDADYWLSRRLPQSVWQGIPRLNKHWGGCQMLVCERGSVTHKITDEDD